MTQQNHQIIPQTPAHQAAVETLLDQAFGLDRRTKSSYRLREGETAIDGLSFLAQAENGQIVGTISFWPIHLGRNGPQALLLGPLAVRPDCQRSGLGQKLMQHGIAAAKAAGHKLILLVGDAPYYAKLGFQKVPQNQLLMPGPNDPARLLFRELVPGSLNNATGLIRSPSRYRTTPFHNKPGSK
jgi:predicted N-acetyltransferase YhbS